MDLDLDNADLRRDDVHQQRTARSGREGRAPEGTVVSADEQTAGHGRLGKQWFSPPGVNLYASVLFRTLIPPRVKQRVLPTDIVGGRRGLWRMA